MILTRDEISPALALQDFVPVMFFAAGLFFAAKMIAGKNSAAGNLAYLGGILVTLGGVFKASWKLIQAFGGADIAFLNNSLFTLMSAGFTCLAWALWKSRGGEKSFAKIFLVPLILIGILWSAAACAGFFTESRAWFFILLGATTLANLTMLFQLIYRSFQNKLWLAATLFSVNLIVIFVLARTSDQTVTLQWMKQIMNTVSQAAFAAASWILLKKNLP